ncbi:MAG TPA: M56 family metallopeptidase [Planctomycetota bacterium]
MSPFTNLFEVLPSRLGFAAIDMLAVACMVWVICCVLRPRSARVRSLLWLLVPLKGFATLLVGSPFVLGPAPWSSANESPAPVHASAEATFRAAPAERAPLAPVAAFTTSPTAAPAAAAATPAAANVPPEATPGFEVGTLLSSLWLLGVAMLAARSVRDRFRGARLVRRSEPGQPAWRRLVAQYAAVLGVRPPEILRTSSLASPALVGVLRPVILIPDWMDSHATVAWAIRHELMHAAMRDPWAALVHELGRIVFFFHPVAWIARRQWEAAAELACDRALVHDENECLEYADRLHTLAARLQPRPMLAHGLFAARSRVGKRIEALLTLPAGPARVSRRAGLAITTLFAATLAAGVGTVPADFVFTGTVLDGDGKPLAGAAVAASVFDRYQAAVVELATTQTDAGGRFSLGYDHADLPFDPDRTELWQSVLLCAYAARHGPDWVLQKDLARLDGVELRLPRDFALKGRLLDEDGQPMRGVQLRAVSIQTTKEGSLDAWRATLGQGGSVQALSKRIYLLPAARAPVAVTDGNGAFELTGVGAECIYGLQYLGGDAALGRMSMVTSQIDPEQLAKIVRPMEAVHAPGSNVVVERTRPIDGVVVDAVTGAPIASADVYSQVLNGMFDRSRQLRTRTDAEGRFRLLGMRRGTSNQLVVAARGDEPYFLREVKVPDPPGLDPVELRIPLHKGVWITGKAVDGATGKPVRGQVTYHPHLFNPLVLQIDQFKDRTIDGFEGAFRAAADGTFRIPGLPGRGLVGIEAFAHYRMGVGYDPKWEERKEGARAPQTFFLTDGSPHEPGPKWPHAMALIEIAEGNAPAPVTLTLDPGQTVRVTVLDAAGQRTSDYEVKPTGWSNRNVHKAEDGTLELLCLAPDEQRLIDVRRPDDSAGVIARLGPAQQTATVHMQPSATIRGTLLDADGVPLVENEVLLYLLPERVPVRGRVKTDAKGQFRMPAPPASQYQLLVSRPVSREELMAMRTPGFYTVANTQALEPGQSLDLGTVRVGKK